MSNTEKCVEQLIFCHNNPVIKTEIFGSKLFMTPLSEQEQSNQNRCLESIEKALRHVRVDRRCSRNIAEWLPKTKTVLVTKTVGSSLAELGIQNKNGKYLTPEEALYLLENNKLELLHNNLTLSIQEAYNCMLNRKYFVYKRLVNQSCKLKSLLKTSTINSAKKLKATDSRSETQSVHKAVDSPMDDIFKQLRQNGPQLYFDSTGNRNTFSDYLVISCNDQRKSNRNLIVESGNAEFASANVVTDSTSALYFNDTISLYTFSIQDVTVM